jgi:hypothetical protein
LLKNLLKIPGVKKIKWEEDLALSMLARFSSLESRASLVAYIFRPQLKWSKRQWKGQSTGYEGKRGGSQECATSNWVEIAD